MFSSLVSTLHFFHHVSFLKTCFYGRRHSCTVFVAAVCLTRNKLNSLAFIPITEQQKSTRKLVASFTMFPHDRFPLGSSYAPSWHPRCIAALPAALWTPTASFPFVKPARAAHVPHTGLQNVSMRTLPLHAPRYRRAVFGARRGLLLLSAPLVQPFRCKNRLHLLFHGRRLCYDPPTGCPQKMRR